jgi:hypothetical protein
MTQLRERIRTLEQKLAELITFGEENDAISERMHRATLAMIAAPGIDDLLGTFYFHLREDFAVPHIALRIWGTNNASEREEFAEVSEEVFAFTDSLTSPYCAQHPMFESADWFADAQPPLQSFAYVKLAGERFNGLMVLASEDAERFYPEMGTLYLQRLGDIASAAIARYLD